MPCSCALRAGILGGHLGGVGCRLARTLEALAAEHDQAIVLPCASVMVIIVLLNEALTCATPDVMFFFSRLRTLARPAGAVVSWPSVNSPAAAWRPIMRYASNANGDQPNGRPRNDCDQAFFLPAIGLAGPLRVRALVCVRWPRTGSPLRWRRPR